ncbi:hypothetical protein EDD85DRAFT_81217 [Armillaria nabsnona]|nr:hypothetical protein EDD85DRAFT_81217 [Armillaria nabsnona]
MGTLASLPFLISASGPLKQPDLIWLDAFWSYLLYFHHPVPSPQSILLVSTDRAQCVVGSALALASHHIKGLPKNRARVYLNHARGTLSMGYTKWQAGLIAFDGRRSLVWRIWGKTTGRTYQFESTVNPCSSRPVVNRSLPHLGLCQDLAVEPRRIGVSSTLEGICYFRPTRTNENCYAHPSYN